MLRTSSASHASGGTKRHMSAPGGTRTPNRRIRSPMLYPLSHGRGLHVGQRGGGPERRGPGNVGCLEGFEPTTTGATIQCSTPELQAPLKDDRPVRRGCEGRETVRLRGFEPPTGGLEVRCSVLAELQAHESRKEHAQHGLSKSPRGSDYGGTLNVCQDAPRLVVTSIMPSSSTRLRPLALAR